MPQLNPNDPPAAPPSCVSPFPDLGGLYLLVAGIVLGVLLGPAVLGRLAPSTYEDAFVGGRQFTQQIDEKAAAAEEQVRALDGTGATPVAITEQLNQQDFQLIELRAKKQQAQQDQLASLTGWTTSLMLAVIAMMMLESLLSPDTRSTGSFEISPSLGRLVTARYALCALWIAIMLAQPKLLSQLPIVFAGLLIVVSLAVALVPLGPKK
jgi:preprotein translocase subunit SecF